MYVFLQPIPNIDLTLFVCAWSNFTYLIMEKLSPESNVFWITFIDLQKKHM